MHVLIVTLFAGLAVALHAGTAAAQNTPPVGDPVNGKAVFTFGNTSCTNCHGVDGVGGWGPDLAGKNISYAQAVRAIRLPIWRMPAFAPSQLTDQEIADMVAYWNTLKPTPTLSKWKVDMVGADAPRGDARDAETRCRRSGRRLRVVQADGVRPLQGAARTVEGTRRERSHATHASARSHGQFCAEADP
jgi:mono/diheme cytochrome c family protein